MENTANAENGGNLTPMKMTFLSGVPTLLEDTKIGCIRPDEDLIAAVRGALEDACEDDDLKN